MATRLYGLGLQSIMTNDDFDLACVAIDGNRPELLTVDFTFGSYDGNVVFKSRRRGSSAAFVTQSYVKPDGTVSAAAIAADTNIQIDVTGKDLRMTSAGSTTGTLLAGLDVTSDL